MISVLRRALIGAVLLGVCIAPASIAPANAASEPKPSLSASVGSKAASFTKSCYGYTGTFKSGTQVLNASWSECFGIAPDRTIWHAWPNSGGWKLMPNNGLADDMFATGIWAPDYTREVCVVVSSTGAIYRSNLVNGSWVGWKRAC